MDVYACSLKIVSFFICILFAIYSAVIFVLKPQPSSKMQAANLFSERPEIAQHFCMNPQVYQCETTNRPTFDRPIK